MEDIYYSHPEPIWLKDDIYAIHIPLPDKKGEYEQLITEELDNSEFKLLCIPFFLYGVALGDIISVDLSIPKESRDYKIISRSGRSVFRVWFEQYDKKSVDAFRADIVSLGGLTEMSSKRMYAVDAESSSKAEAIRTYLEQGESTGKWIYEDG